MNTRFAVRGSAAVIGLALIGFGGWILFLPAAPAAAGAPSELAGPFLYGAIRDQWGLRLVGTKGTLKVIVVENAQLPTEH